MQEQRVLAQELDSGGMENYLQFIRSYMTLIPDSIRLLRGMICYDYLKEIIRGDGNA